MLKKRVIFTLLYNNGDFMLSRNFRLQKVGNLQWLQSNYNFSQISYSIDELVVLDVTREKKSLDHFCSVLKKLAEGCFVPIAAGGGIRSIEAARDLLRSGADKVVINSSLYSDNGFIGRLASEFGRQCIVASMDVKTRPDGDYQLWSECGSKSIDGAAKDWVACVAQDDIGELYLNSMDRDGTGQGYDLKLLQLLPLKMTKPVIIAGGVGNALHLAEGLADSRVDAVATAHLYNFIGDGLKKAREFLIASGIKLPFWDVQMLEAYLNNKVDS
jgi:imidazole glycerol-phosphate synthase subunit HisF